MHASALIALSSAAVAASAVLPLEVAVGANSSAATKYAASQLTLSLRALCPALAFAPASPDPATAQWVVGPEAALAVGVEPATLSAMRAAKDAKAGTVSSLVCQQ